MLNWFFITVRFVLYVFTVYCCVYVSYSLEEEVDETTTGVWKLLWHNLQHNFGNILIWFDHFGQVLNSTLLSVYWCKMANYKYLCNKGWVDAIKLNCGAQLWHISHAMYTYDHGCVYKSSVLCLYFKIYSIPLKKA